MQLQRSAKTDCYNKLLNMHNIEWVRFRVCLWQKVGLMSLKISAVLVWYVKRYQWVCDYGFTVSMLHLLQPTYQITAMVIAAILYGTHSPIGAIPSFGDCCMQRIDPSLICMANGRKVGDIVCRGLWRSQPIAGRWATPCQHRRLRSDLQRRR